MKKKLYISMPIDPHLGYNYCIAKLNKEGYYDRNMSDLYRTQQEADARAAELNAENEIESQE